MSLKTLHIIFITSSILVLAGFGIWSFYHYSATGDVSMLMMGCFSLGVALSLVYYGKRFLQKLRHISYM